MPTTVTVSHGPTQPCDTDTCEIHSQVFFSKQMLDFVKMPMRGADHSYARTGMPTPNQPDITKKMKKHCVS